jgi:peptidylprolyl isomerase
LSKVKDGDTVKVHYTGSLEDGSVFDSSEDKDPLEFTLGTGQLIPGFEKAVEGMAQGDKAKVTIPANDAYGQVRDDLVISVPGIIFPRM